MCSARDGYVTYYAHLKEVVVKKEQIVKRGELIGYSGISTAQKIFPHLHFEMMKPLDLSKISSAYRVDPYRSLVPPLGSQLSSWTKDNDPQYVM